MFCAFGAAFVLLGFRGLRYFRSDLAREQFARDPAAASLREPESSAVVIYSAVAWLLALTTFNAFDPIVRGLARADEKPANARQSADQREAAENPASARRELPMMPVPIAQELAPASLEDQSKLQDRFPDLEVIGLCASGYNTVFAIVKNRGGIKDTRTLSTSPWRYRLQYSDLGFRDSSEVSWASVPRPGSSGLVTLDNTSDPSERSESLLDVVIRADIDNYVHESDENNNTKVFRINYRYSTPTNVPRCRALPHADSLTRLDAPQGGTAQSPRPSPRPDGGMSVPITPEMYSRPQPSSVEKDSRLPDLVIDGLCVTGKDIVMVLVRNDGEGRGDLAVPNRPDLGAKRFDVAFTELRSRAWPRTSGGSIPRPGRIGLLTLDTTTSPLESGGGERNLQVFVDSNDVVSESDETNNRREFHIRYEGSRVANVPNCQQLRKAGAFSPRPAT